LPEDAKQAFRRGAARAIQDQIDRVKGLGDVTKRIFNDTRTKDQIKAAFGDDAYKAFEKSMNAEKLMADTRAFVTGNSRTAQRLNDSGDVAQQVAEDFLRGGKHNVMSGMIERAIARGRGINDATGAELADMLTASSPKARAEIMKALLEQQGKAQTSQRNLLGAAAIADLLAAQQVGMNLGSR